MRRWKAAAKSWIESAGFEVRRLSPVAPRWDADLAIRDLVGEVEKPVVLDVGANEGQSVQAFRQLLPGCEVHAFEPSPTTFARLSAALRGQAGVHLNRCGVGEAQGALALRESSEPTMTSFLEPGPDCCWGEPLRTTDVPVVTLDQYCGERGIAFVDVLKTDTQGFDFQVISGAAGMIAENRIHVIKTELIFSDMYQGQVPAEDYHKHLRGAGFRLVGYYDFGFQDGLLSWCDAIFVNPDAAGTR